MPSERFGGEFLEEKEQRIFRRAPPVEIRNDFRYQPQINGTPQRIR